MSSRINHLCTTYITFKVLKKEYSKTITLVRKQICTIVEFIVLVFLFLQ